jgi:uracil-DNA glycosylase family 4
VIAGDGTRESLPRVADEVVACRMCPRLVAHRERVAREKRRAYLDWDYWGHPVPGFGDATGRLIVVGLAPGAHGANRTGRLFTGDSSGDTLFAALHTFGFASQAESVSRADGLTLTDCFITAAVRCAPPENRPAPEEFDRCRPYLVRELRLLRRARIYLALGRAAFEALLKALPEAEIGAPVSTRDSARRFGHGVEFSLEHGARRVLASYHPSRQNTQTGRLTRAMFHAVFARARELLD